MDLPTVAGMIRCEGKKRVAFFGRLHKVKAVDNLVSAWAMLMKKDPSVINDWELLIAGPDCGAKEVLMSMVRELALGNVRFVGEINGSAKYEFLSQADIYVLPSLTENFGITLAEALACGTPCIASQGTPWSGLEREKAGRWVPIGSESLVVALKEMMSISDDDRSVMGERGRAWIKRDFSWQGVGFKMKKAYEWLLGKEEMPQWVIRD
jgi:glycosyltransferase involved in cell wall biosynthesis